MEKVSGMFELNKVMWNKRTDIHIDSEFYDMETFKQGRNSLNAFELEILGDISCKKTLHLQCQFILIRLYHQAHQVTAKLMKDLSFC